MTPMPQQHALGFYAFAGCVLVATYSTLQQQAGLPQQETEVVPVAAALAHEAQLSQVGAALISATSAPLKAAVEALPMQGSDSKPEIVKSTASSVVTFDSRAFATSEKAVAAVFILNRTSAASGRARVQWAVHSGTADAGIDFSDASGTVRFAEGQQQLAIYVPLRNDLLKEQDETFKVCLRSPRQARIGGRSCAEATIRDDDTYPIYGVLKHQHEDPPQKVPTEM